ncbi:MAG: hypothetical protein KKF41_00420 [Actinobacteria bacterium]|nr:hypothetical protein [Actinomycetota bacterium]MBU1942710.1 hypothetical protein [Actinomycetota bacterium]MBU2686032.1 hypothetical protein [Actinomycetota bacterium]
MDEVTGQDAGQIAGRDEAAPGEAAQPAPVAAPPEAPVDTTAQVVEAPEQVTAPPADLGQPPQPPEVQQQAIALPVEQAPRPITEQAVPGFLVGSEVARARHIEQPGFEDQLSLLDRDQGLKRKVFIAMSVVLGVFIGGMIAGAVVGIWI